MGDRLGGFVWFVASFFYTLEKYRLPNIAVDLTSYCLNLDE